MAWWSGRWPPPGSAHPTRPGPALAPAAPVAGPGNWDEATAEASPDERADRVRAFVEAAGGLETAGYCRTVSWAGAFANTAGQSVTGRSAEAAMDGIARAGGVDGVARRDTGRLSDLDGAVLGARAAVKARAGAAPVELPPGRYEVVLEPTAVVDLLQNFALFGFNGKAYNERPFVRRARRRAVRPGDHAGRRRAGHARPAVRRRGHPKRRVALVERGVTRTVAHDRRTAAEAGSGAESTGHAVAGGASFGAMPTNLRLLAAGQNANGTGPTEVSGPVVDSDTAALVAGVRAWTAGHRPLVHPGARPEVAGHHRADPQRRVADRGRRGDHGGAATSGSPSPTRRRSRPGAVLGVGRYASLLPDSWDASWWSAPALRLASWNFTGGASG